MDNAGATVRALLAITSFEGTVATFGQGEDQEKESLSFKAVIFQVWSWDQQQHLGACANINP